MPIVLPESLPAVRVLREEGVEVVSGDQLKTDRPLRICLVNLMPNKAATETQIARLLGVSSVPVELVHVFPIPIGQRTHLPSIWRTSIAPGREFAMSASMG